jgi:phosphatidylinositol alpha-mannosyltransferase
MRGNVAGVRFMGAASESAKRRALAEASILVAPNLGGESFGIVLAEGMASGCAIVASRLEPFERVAGEAARFFEVGNSSDLVETLDIVLGDPSLIAAMGAEAERVLKPYDRPAVLAAYLKSYVDAVDQYR